MAILNTSTDKQNTEKTLATAIMQLDAMISVVCTSDDFSSKHPIIKENYLEICSEKIDLIRATTSQLIPNIKSDLNYDS